MCCHFVHLYNRSPNTLLWSLNHSASLSSSPPEDRAAVWSDLLHRSLVRMSLRPHRGAGRPLQLLATHQPLLWLGHSWTGSIQRTLHVDPLLQRRRAGGDRLSSPVQLHSRWLKPCGCSHYTILVLSECSSIVLKWMLWNVSAVISQPNDCTLLISPQKILSFICTWEDS